MAVCVYVSQFSPGSELGTAHIKGIPERGLRYRYIYNVDHDLSLNAVFKPVVPIEHWYVGRLFLCGATTFYCDHAQPRPYSIHTVVVGLGSRHMASSR